MQPQQALARPDYRRAERAALDILRESGVCAPPVNPLVLARNLGVHIKFVRFEGEYGQVSGFYDFEDNAIYVNKQEYPLRQSFTIAHELGHKILHDEWVRSADYTLSLRDTVAPADDPYEIEADAFAATLLMPRHLLDKFYDQPVPTLSQLFVVSTPVVKARLAVLYGVR